MKPRNPGTPWYEQAFGKLYPVVYAQHSEEEAQRQVEFVLRLINSMTPMLVLDLACGNGRHQRALVRAGHKVAGLDLSRELLAAARERGSKGLLCGDMRQLPFEERTFHLVVSFFSSFGYFATKQEDQAVLNEVGRILRPRGRFFLDFLNAQKLPAMLIPETERQEGPYRIRERRRLQEGCVRKQVTVLNAKQEVLLSYEESVRLHDAQSLQAMLEQAGLRVRKCLGGWSSESVSEGKRLLLMAERSL